MSDNIAEVERIVHAGEIIAVIVPRGVPLQGFNFFSDDSDPIQFGVNVFNESAESRPHIHLERESVVTRSQEVLFVAAGRVELSLYAPDAIYLTKRELREGDCVFLASGGHGLKALGPSRVVEVKQGPYRGVDADKRFI